MEETAKLDDFTAFVLHLRETDLEHYASEVLRASIVSAKVPDKLKGLCTNGNSDAEDLADWTVREALKRRDEFDPQAGPDCLKTWIRAICRQEAKNTVPLDPRECSAFDGEYAYAGWDDTWDHADRLLQAGRRFLARESALTPQQRKCLLGAIKGETMVESGQRLGISPQTVHQHRKAAIEKMQARTTSSQHRRSTRVIDAATQAKRNHARSLADQLLRNLEDMEEAGEQILESILTETIEED